MKRKLLKSFLLPILLVIILCAIIIIIKQSKWANEKNSKLIFETCCDFDSDLISESKDSKRQLCTYFEVKKGEIYEGSIYCNEIEGDVTLDLYIMSKENYTNAISEPNKALAGKLLYTAQLNNEGLHYTYVINSPGFYACCYDFTDGKCKGTDMMKGYYTNWRYSISKILNFLNISP